jgi:sugar diacid utilization regulator
VPDFDMDAIERYLATDGYVRRGNGLVAFIDGDACGFITRLPRTAPPHAIGISSPAPLTSMQPAFRQATRALDTALTLGYKGVFGIGDLGIHPALVVDAEVGDVMLERYVRPVLALSGGDAILTTVERYLINDRSVDITARELVVHSNTVRQRLAKFEDITQRSLRDTEVVVELWWALQRRHVIGT